MSNMSKTLSMRQVQPGTEKFGRPSHIKFEEAVASVLPEATVISEPRVFKRLGFWAMVPDYALVVNGRMIFFEIKRQGGNGNAHERLYKNFTAKKVSTIVNQFDLDEYPLYGILCDSLATNPRYRREFEQNLEPENYLLWDYSLNSISSFLTNIVSRHVGIPLDKLASAA